MTKRTHFRSYNIYIQQHHTHIQTFSDIACVLKLYHLFQEDEIDDLAQ